jgi:hypothetical protein
VCYDVQIFEFAVSAPSVACFSGFCARSRFKFPPFTRVVRD